MSQTQPAVNWKAHPGRVNPNKWRLCCAISGPARNCGLGGLKSLDWGEASLESVIGKTAESRRGLDV